MKELFGPFIPVVTLCLTLIIKLMKPITYPRAIMLSILNWKYTGCIYDNFTVPISTESAKQSKKTCYKQIARKTDWPPKGWNISLRIYKLTVVKHRTDNWTRGKFDFFTFSK
jgi:hypothetical protein